MRVLMLGWDFSPRLSGGVGSACRGLATALARDPGAEVVFVLPRVRGDEEPEEVAVVADTEWIHAPAPGHGPSRTAAAPPAAPHAAPRQAPTAHVPQSASDRAPTLPSPADALRLLALDSPLQPYLTPDEYGSLARVRLSRARSAAAAPLATQVATQMTREEPAPAPVAFPAPSAPGARAPAAPERAPPAPADAPVPPYGRTLSAEVERYARNVLALALREPFDVIHAHDWMTFPAALLVRERTGKPLVVQFHSSEPERRGRAREPDPLARAVEQAALDAADRVVCVSEASARVLRAHYAVEPARLRVVHDAFAPLGRPAAGAGRAPDARERTVLFLGRLSEQKAPDVFLRAAALVRAHELERGKRARRRTRFVVAGDGALYPELVALARELGIARDVRFTGFLSGDALVDAYTAADAYVLSSAAEPFGIGALEALSLGVPTIVPQGAGVTEVVRSVLTFEPLDEVDLADRIVALLDHPALRRQLAADGLREVREIRWDRPARVLRGIYDELVPARG